MRPWPVVAIALLSGNAAALPHCPGADGINTIDTCRAAVTAVHDEVPADQPAPNQRARPMAPVAAQAASIAAYLGPGQTMAQLTAGLIDAAPVISTAEAVGPVQLPCGTYRMDGPIAWPAGGKQHTGLRGLTAGCTILQMNFAGNLITAVGYLWLDIEDITFRTLVTQTNSTIITLRNGYDATLNNIIFQAEAGPSFYNDIVLDGANTTRLVDLDLRPGSTGTCVAIIGTAKPTLDTFVEHSSINGCNYGLTTVRSSGVYMTDVEMTGSVSAAVLINPQAPNDVNAFFVKNVLADGTSAGHGFWVSGSGNVTELRISQLWAGGSGSPHPGNPPTFKGGYDGLRIDNTHTDGVQIEHLYAHFNGGSGLTINGGRHIQVADAITCQNSMFANNTYPGIAVGAAVDYIQISNPYGGRCGYMSITANKSAGFSNRQNYGMIINNNAMQHVTVLGGQYESNVTGTWTHTAEANFLSAATPP